MWEVVRTDRLTRELLEQLLRNELCAIRIPGFILPEACRLAMHGVRSRGTMEYYKNIQPPIGRIGITQYEHMGSAELKAEYFRKAPGANAARRAIFRDSGDPVGLVISRLQDAWGLQVDLAVDNEMEYFAGLVRDIPLAQLHRDWAPADARDWSIGGISAQLTWNIYLQLGEKGGAVVIYRRFYDEHDEAQKMMPNNCAYNARAVAGCDFVEIVPSLGELLLFNSRNYHKVEKTDAGAERITASSFIGLTPDRHLVLWS